jgi:DNA invertase Pin-like site-specific DNA recombinase
MTIANSEKGQLSELLSLFQAGKDLENEVLKPENLRYALYARRSTVDEGRQEKSIPDQIADCLDRVVIPNKITLADSDIIEEKGSAKEPDIRPKFRQMLNDIIAGKYDGIICWHPDRLARNMKEAGEIIDMLDKGIIKDLRFATSTFENSPTGKMLLGISFVLSKQYSEHLSESVTRGNRRKTENGWSLGRMQHGYYIADGKLFPDGENYNIIHTAFEMRLQGKSQAVIERYLNNRNDYRVFRKINVKDKHGKVVKRTSERTAYKWDKDAVSSLLKDTCYVGILQYGKAYCVLGDFYDFTPILTEPEYLTINPRQNLENMRFQALQSRKESISAKLLNGRLICGDCKQTLSAGITTKKQGTERRFRYRCETQGCPMYYKFTTVTNYDNYKVEMVSYQQSQRKELTKLVASLAKQVSDKEREYNNAMRIASDPTHRLAERYTAHVELIDADLMALRKDLKEAKQTKEQLNTAILSYEKYLELFKNVAVSLRSDPSLELLDVILSKFFSNLVLQGSLVPPKNAITRWEITDFKLREPYAGFYKDGNFELGRGDRT